MRVSGRDSDELRRFLRGWFGTIAFVRQNKAETVRITRANTRLSEPVADKVYDIEMPMFLTSGHFDPAALKAVLQSLVDLGEITAIPADAALVTDKFLP
jgi:ABC-type nitrate/sulfonate/bicarbonate transport system substrate-binding protein